MGKRLAVGMWIHLTGNQEMGIEIEGCRRKVSELRSLKHMLLDRDDDGLEKVARGEIYI